MTKSAPRNGPPSRRNVAAAIATCAAAAALWPAMAPAARRQGPAPAIRLRRGMNLWPWFSLTREFPPPRTDYDWPPFQATRPVPDRRDLAALRKSGIDFVRVPVDPGPFLAFSGARRAELLAQVVGAVETAVSEDLSVVLNLHPNGAGHYWNPRNLVRGPEDRMFAQYLDLVAAVAARLGRFDPSRVAFEPLNEPPQDCRSVQWPALQAEIVRTARGAAPGLTLILSGACGSMIAGLEALDPIQDANVVYTFHFYEPYVFSHQGAPWMTSEPMYRYLNAVPWPSSEGSKPATLAAVAERMNLDRTVPPAEKREIAALIDRVLGQYFEARPDRWYIEKYFRRVAAWAARHDIDPSCILLGEFGALRSDARYVAAKPADRARYIRDVREVAEASGFAWAFWNYFDGMGLTIDDHAREFDPSVMGALGLRPPDAGDPPVAKGRR
jgi:hypothetical protein